MNTMIEQECDICYECKVASKSKREEPIKVTTIPSTAWEHVAIDFGGPYPDGHYNLVAVDLRSRYPVVETISSTNFKATKEKFKKIVTTYGIPRKIQSDNGPPFNSEDFRRFTEEERIQSMKTVTPLHPRANGEAESFMRVINKTEQITALQSRDKSEREIAIQKNTNCIQINTTSSNWSNTIPGNAEQRKFAQSWIAKHHKNK